MKLKRSRQTEEFHSTSHSGKRFYINNGMFTSDVKVALKQAGTNSAGSITTIYGDDIVGQLYKLVQTHNFNDQQVEVASKLVGALIRIEDLQGASSNVNIAATEDEDIVITRKSSGGVSVVSIDNFENIMVHFAGYSGQKSVDFFDSNDYDAEGVVYTYMRS